MPAAAEAERTVSVRGLEIFVRERGKGFPLLMINGIGANVDMLDATETALARRSRTIAFDAPGTGRSSTPIFPLSIVSVAKVARDLLDELGYTQADVLGFSHGGLVAQELARLAPERVRRLALVSTACGWGSHLGDPAALSVLATPLRYYSRSFSARTSQLYGERDRMVDASLREARVGSPPSLLGYAYQLLAAVTWSSLPWLGTLQQPTLVIAGDDDRVTVTANGVQLARLIENSRLHLLPGEGHLALFDPASGAQPLLADFFSAPDLATATSWEGGLQFGNDGDVLAA
ncbi:MAG: alpha/beta fold hydrolase [Gaiellaceae bacterium]